MLESMWRELEPHDSRRCHKRLTIMRDSLPQMIESDIMRERSIDLNGGDPELAVERS
jgi:hypothetical protein